jgi:hypothetical protein
MMVADGMLDRKEVLLLGTQQISDMFEEIYGTQAGGL